MRTYTFGLYNGKQLIASIEVNNRVTKEAARNDVYTFVLQNLGYEFTGDDLYIKLTPEFSEYTEVSALERIYG